MAEAKRDIGREILQGLREIKRGQHGRVVNIPSVASIREKPDSLRSASLRCWAYRNAPCRTGSRAAELRQARLVHCCSSLNKIQKHGSMPRRGFRCVEGSLVITLWINPMTPSLPS